MTVSGFQRSVVLRIFSHTQVHVVAIVINRKNESIPRGLAKLKIQDSQANIELNIFDKIVVTKFN